MIYHNIYKSNVLQHGLEGVPSNRTQLDRPSQVFVNDPSRNK